MAKFRSVRLAPSPLFSPAASSRGAKPRRLRRSGAIEPAHTPYKLSPKRSTQPIAARLATGPFSPIAVTVVRSGVRGLLNGHGCSCDSDVAANGDAARKNACPTSKRRLVHDPSEWKKKQPQAWAKRRSGSALGDYFALDPSRANTFGETTPGARTAFSMLPRKTFHRALSAPTKPRQAPAPSCATGVTSN